MGQTPVAPVEEPLKSIVLRQVIFQLKPAGNPMLPIGSTARTRNWCVPDARPEKVFGPAHGAYAALSSLHSNVAAGSVELNSKVAVVEVVEVVGWDVIVVCGGVRSTVQV